MCKLNFKIKKHTERDYFCVTKPKSNKSNS